MAAQNNYQNDIPVEVKGYVTDPKLVGYQILTNYESTYWRRLVGRDAWSLYEVLRSFCHKDSVVCSPSINTLVDILGAHDRRLITGRATNSENTQRAYDGWIDVLQDCGLAYAKQRGEGPSLRYEFHVNLTPPPLNAKQVEQLPKSLQKKHARLLERVAEAANQFVELEEGEKVKQRKGEKGMVNDHTPLVYDHTPSGHRPDKQQQVNNTHKTTTKSEVDLKNNNNSGEPDTKHDVVVALINKGIAKNVAQRLAHRYSRKRILEKIEYLEYLQETDPQKVTNPRGWLRRAIEDDYGKPDGFKSRAEREAEAAAAEKRRQALKEHEAQQQVVEGKKRQKAQKAREEKLTAVKMQYNTTPETEALWSSWLSHIRATDPTGAALLQSGCELLAIHDHEVVLWVDNIVFLKKVQRQYAKTLKQLAARHLKISFTEVELKPVIAAKNSEDTDP